MEALIFFGQLLTVERRLAAVEWPSAVEGRQAESEKWTTQYIELRALLLIFRSFLFYSDLPIFWHVAFYM